VRGPFQNAFDISKQAKITVLETCEPLLPVIESDGSIEREPVFSPFTRAAGGGYVPRQGPWRILARRAGIRRDGAMRLCDWLQCCLRVKPNFIARLIAASSPNLN